MAGGVLIKAVDALAGEITKRLVDAAGAGIRKKYGVAPRKAALERAMTEALAGAITNLTKDENLMEHYLGMFRQWMLRDGVIDELTQVIDPRPDMEPDFQKLREEFEAAGYDPKRLGEGVNFEDVITHFMRAFLNAAKKEGELQDEIKIGLLERLVQLTEQMLDQVQNRAPTNQTTEFIFGPSFNARVIKIYASPAGQAKLSETDVKRILSEYLDYVIRAYNPQQG